MFIVLDASVITKWFIQEIDSEKALEYKRLHSLGESFIHIPLLLYSEITNTLSNNKKLSLKEIDNFLESLELLRLREETFFSIDHKGVARISRQFNLSGYDASYVYLAQKLNTQLITADKKLFEKTRKSGFVKLL